ncbi:hypothetical protein B484DRAFT_426673 [Ochromonadaceae sp. CCMP2298]|nr:hypothetical protein B484DRAFT_426673 [Ochromonadaceae sp. CCMP2298]
MKYLAVSSTFALLCATAAILHSAVADTNGTYPQPIDLGAATSYAVLAATTVTSTGVVGTVVDGNLGVYPGSAVEGFPPAKVNGAIDTANGASGAAQGSLTSAYNTLAGLAADADLTSSDLGGSAAAMNGMLTLDALGDANSTWVFQISSSLLIALGSSIIFKDTVGNPDYVYFQVASSITTEKNVAMQGNFLAFQSISMGNGATVTGRLLAMRAAVTLDLNTVTGPAYQTPTAEPTTAPSAPSVAPTTAPTFVPTNTPTPAPSTAPTPAPTFTPTTSPTNAPSFTPTTAPSDPSFAPTQAPTFSPSVAPTLAPTTAPSPAPSFAPFVAPTSAPTLASNGSSPSVALSDGAIAGIAVGGAVAVAAVVAAVAFFTGSGAGAVGGGAVPLATLGVSAV